MNIREMKEIINRCNLAAGKPQYYNVKYTDGRELTMRLFVSTWDAIAQVAKGKKRSGYHISMENIESINLSSQQNKGKKLEIWEQGEKNRKRAIAMLEKSGLNPHYLKEIRELGEITETVYNDYKARTLHYEKMNTLDAFFIKPEKTIKTIDWTTRGYPNESRRVIVQGYIKNQTPFNMGWEGRSYDISISIEQHEKDNGKTAYYAEEYRGTGNGHYYLLLDENHAIHVEDD